MRVKTVDGKIVTLRWWRFCHLHYALLVEILNQSPNQVVEIEELGLGRYIPLFKLNLDSFQELAAINA